MDEIKVLLVDDQVLFIESLRNVLETIAQDIRITGTAHDGKEALKLIAVEEPDIVLLDVRMPGMDGVETVKVIRKKFSKVQVMMLTTFDDDKYVHEALEHGAMGYMLKDIPPEDLVSSIRALKAGSIQISPQVFHKLMYSASRNDETIDESEVRNLVDRLSPREREILLLLSEGKDNSHIADEIFIAEQTVKNHISSIYSKLNIHDRTAVKRFSRKIRNFL